MESELKNKRRSQLYLVGLASGIIYSFVTNISTLVASQLNIHSFRSLGGFDQLSYFAFVLNVSTGKSPDIEPLTETGNTYYPRAYYVALGLLSKVTHIEAAVIWWICGVVLQSVLVFVISVTLVRYTNKIWVGFLAPLPLLTGTLAFIFNKEWLWSFDSHAVIWGAFAPLYTLNGESAGLVVASITFTLLISQFLHLKNKKYTLGFLIVAGATLGSLATVHTYVFFVVLFLASYGAAAYGLFRFRSKLATVATLVSLPIIYLVGPQLAKSLGPLAALAFGLIAAVPGLLALLAKQPKHTALPLITLALTCSPMVVTTLLAIRAQDPFLTYRTNSTSNLGVGLWQGFVGGLPVIACMGLVLYYGITRKNALLCALPVAASTVWILLASNDTWGQIRNHTVFG